MHSPRSTPPHATRAYTLIELMAIVAIVGIVSTLAVVSYRKWLDRARENEAKALVVAIVQGQHAYFQETDGYLNCSSAWNDWYPRAPDNKKHNFTNSNHGDYNCWKLLNVHSPGPTYFSFTVRAGLPNETPPNPPPGFSKTGGWPSTVGPWYVIEAMSNVNNDGKYAYFMASSFQPGDVISAHKGDSIGLGGPAPAPQVGGGGGGGGCSLANGGTNSVINLLLIGLSLCLVRRKKRITD